MGPRSPRRDSGLGTADHDRRQRPYESSPARPRPAVVGRGKNRTAAPVARGSENKATAGWGPDRRDEIPGSEQQITIVDRDPTKVLRRGRARLSLGAGRIARRLRSPAAAQIRPLPDGP